MDDELANFGEFEEDKGGGDEPASDYAPDSGGDDDDEEDDGGDDSDFSDAPKGKKSKAKPKAEKKKAPKAKSPRASKAAAPASLSPSASAVPPTPDDVAAAAPPSGTVAAAAATPTKAKPKATKRKAKDDTDSPSAKKAKTAAKPKKAAVKAVGQNEGVALITNYMKQQNRPYSHLQIFENLHQAVKKAHVPKICDQLVAEGKLCASTFGKTVLYYYNQAEFSVLDPAQLEEMDTKLATLKEEGAALKKEVDVLEKECGALQCELTDEQLDHELKLLTEETEAKAERLGKLKSNVVLVTKQEQIAVKERLKKYYKMWRSRKNAFGEMMDAVLDDGDKSAKELMEELGCESDQQHQVDITKFSGLIH